MYGQDWVINLNEFTRFEMSSILRSTDILVTDYSSVWVDYLLLDRPIVGFCYDLDSYLNERGSFMTTKVFSERIANAFPAFLEQLEQRLANGIQEEEKTKYNWVKGMLHAHQDGLNAHRVAEEVLGHCSVQPTN